MKRTERLLKLAMCKHNPKKRKCNKYKTNVPLRMLQESPVPPGSEEEIQYLMDVLDDDSQLIDKTSEEKENRKVLTETSSEKKYMDASTLTQVANVLNPEQAANISIPAQASDVSVLTQAIDVSTTALSADLSIPAHAANVNIPSQAADITIHHLQADNVSVPTQVADTSIMAEAADGNICSQASEILILAQAVDVSVPSQDADASITSQDADLPIPPRAAYAFIPTLAADIDIPSQAADVSIPAQASDVPVLTQAIDVSTPALFVDLSVPSQAADVSIPAQASDVSVLAQAIEVSTPALSVDLSISAQAANVNIPSHAADVTIHVQPANVYVPTQVVDTSITTQATDFSIPETTAYVFIPAQAADVNIASQTDDDPSLTQAVEVLVPIQAADISIHVPAVNLSIPIQASNVSTPAQAADIDTEGQLEFPLDFAISIPEVFNLISPLPNLSSVTSISEHFTDSSSVNSTPKSRMATKKKDKGRLRCTYKSEWKDMKRKMLKNSGKSYSSRDGTERTRKEMKPPCACKKNCIQKIAQEQRKEIFQNFWKLSDHTRQWDFIAKFARSSIPKRINSEAPNRSQTISYYLPTSSDENAEQLVCRTMFLNTLSVSEKTVRTALKKLKEGNGTIAPDQRGVHLNRPHKILQSTRQSSIDHITSLVPVESHYCIKRTSKLYLDGNLNFSRLYKLYKEWYEKNQDKYEKLATQRQYHDTVNENFNIEFYAPKKDLCDTCHVYDNLKNPSNEEKQNYEKHIDRKKLARNIKDKDKEAAIGSNGKIVAGCFDLQKVLTCPHGNVSIFYYKRKLSLYNFTVFDMAEKSGYCYMWQEVTGKKGANEISSGLFIFILRKVESGVKEFRFWSDNCSGQNRNRIVFAMYQYMVMNRNVESITHRFLEVGHTQTEGDNMHSVIERASKDKMVYTAEQWYNLIRWAKSSGPPYSVHELTQEDIMDFKSLLDGRNWVKNDNNEKVIWSQVKEIHINNENSHIVHYKYELDSPQYSSLTTIKKTRSRKIIINTVHRAYETSLAISKDKYRDLIGLCQAKIIPEEFHRFFNTFKYNEEGVGSESADEEA